MSLQKDVQRMLLEKPDPGRIARVLLLVLIKTFLTPGSSFGTRSEKRLSLVLYDHARKFFKGTAGLDRASGFHRAPGFHRDGRSVFTSLFAPTELVYAFDFLPFSLEILAAVAASMELTPELLSRAEHNWLSTDFCSFHRAYMELVTAGMLPKPSFLLATSHTCDGTFKSFSHVSAHIRSPFLLIDTPYHNDGEAVRYLAGQLAEAAAQIEEITKTVLKKEKLERAFHFSNQARAALMEINELKKSPLPLMYGEESLAFVLISGNLMGSASGVTLFESYRKELGERLRKGYNGIEGKKRILWLHLKPFFPSTLMRYLERELKAVVVAEEINSVYWDELDMNDPWTSLARKLLSNYWVGNIEKRLKYIRKTIEEYRIDGVIHFSHWGCRQSNGGVRLIKDTVQEYGIPFLNLDGDCVDPRNYSEGQYVTRLEGFMEIMG